MTVVVNPQIVLLYDANGVALAVSDGVAIPANTRGLLFAGKDGSGASRFASVDASGDLRLQKDSIRGVADTGNSSTTPLGSNATFTGTAFDVLNYPTAVISVKADAASASNGFKFQWSPDGTNWDVASETSVPANGGRGFHLSHRGRYFRVVYVNGAAEQTAFRLDVFHRPSTVGVISRPLDDVITDDNFVHNVRAFVTAKDPQSVYRNIGATEQGDLRVGYKAFVSISNNANAVVLTPSQVWTGAYEHVDDFSGGHITLSIVGGLCEAYIEWSRDGVAVNHTTNSGAKFVGGAAYSVPIEAEYMRLRFVNADVVDATINVETVFSYNMRQPVAFPVGGTPDPSWSAHLVKSILSGTRPDGKFGNIPADRNNFLVQTIGDIGPLAESRMVGADKSIFGAGVVASKISQIIADFSKALANNDVGTTVSGGGSVTQGSGLATLSTSTATTASAKAFTNSSPKYSPGREHFAQFTALFTTPTSANSHQRAGIYSSTGSPQNGFFVGYQGTTFGITVRSAGTDTFTARSSWNGDMLDAAATSHFVRAGVPEAIDFTKLNVFRIRYGWLGSAVIIFQVMAPDGNWVTLHTVRQPNVSATPSITAPSNPFTMEVIKSSADATDLVMKTGSWDVGSVEDPTGYGPEDVRSNKQVHAVSAAQSADVTVHTVAAGRVLLVTTLIIFVVNSSLATEGRLDIKDGGTGGTLKLPITMGNSSNQTSATVQQSFNFPTPMRFSTSLFADVISGSLTYSITAIGYEVAA